ncbi:MAG TPA: hypothetical protein VJU77_09970 [Chthoniobacterales bacterium]|nr:hypothetical protein [Chthoniobacterales bacterium]
MTIFRSILCGAVLVFSFGALGGEPKSMPASIGTAEMKADGTILLRLRGELPGGGNGEGQLVYPKTHPDYRMILEHISPIAPGQSVSARPWPERKSSPISAPVSARLPDPTRS